MYEIRSQKENILSRIKDPSKKRKFRKLSNKQLNI